MRTTPITTFLIIALLVATNAFSWGKKEDPSEFQVEVEVQVVAFGETDIQSLADREGHSMVTTTDLADLRRSGKGKLLFCPRVVTLSGWEAQVKGVIEFTYPTEFSQDVVQQGIQSKSNSVGSQTSADFDTDGMRSALVPAAFETREVGALLTVVPVAHASQRTITLTLTPQIVGDPTLIDWFNGRPLEGDETSIGAVQPVFPVNEFTTQFSLRDGGTVTLGGTGRIIPGHMIYWFVSARILDMHAEPLD